MKYSRLTSIIIAIGFYILTCTSAFAQEVSVEPTLKGITFGPVGITGYYEKAISNNQTVRLELGMQGYGGFESDPDGTNVIYQFQPSITAATRWYYNLEKRNRRHKNISHNSANFISLLLNGYMAEPIITDDTYYDSTSSLFLGAAWGLKRSIVKKFNFECMVGFGQNMSLGKQSDDFENGMDVILSIRFGYDF